MKKIIRHIEYLVSRNDCVIIPGLGAILAQYESARMDAETNIFLPPRRVIVFNQSLDTRDNMLAASIARADSISLKEAKAIVTIEVESIKRALMSGYTINFGALGTMKADYDCQSIIFEPNAIDTYSTSTIWLTAIQLTALPQSAPQPGVAPMRRHNIFIRKAVRIAASIALLIGVCFLASTPLTIDDAAMASLAPDIKPIEPEELLPAPAIADEDLTELTEDEDITTAEEKVIQEEVIPADINEETYLVVVATLFSEANAEKFVNEHKSEALHYTKRGKFYSIYSGEYASHSEASNACRIARQKYSDAWVCKK